MSEAALPFPAQAPASAPAPAPAAPPTAPAPARPHLAAVDVVRVVMIAGVIAVHTVRYTTNPGDTLVGAVTGILHLNREVFFFLTAFVLTYAYGGRQRWSVWRFWERRYKLVIPAYLAWTVLYLLVDPGPHFPLSSELHRLAVDLATGNARYHLYFLLVTMQIYAVYPALLSLLKSARRYHVHLLVGSLVAQTVLTAAMHYGPAQSGVLGYWFTHPDPLLISYPFYVVAGGIAAMHFDGLTGCVRRHARAVLVLVLGALAVDLATYALDLRVLHQGAIKAAEVFQPVVALTATAAMLGLYTLGVRWEDRGEERRGRAALSRASDVSFGVFLVHPLLLQGLLDALTPVARPAAAGRIPSWLVLPVDFLVVIPLLYVTAAILVRVLRRTRLSLWLTGRPRVRPAD